jgi:hypothetical protein
MAGRPAGRLRAWRQIKARAIPSPGPVHIVLHCVYFSDVCKPTYRPIISGLSFRPKIAHTHREQNERGPGIGLRNVALEGRAARFIPPFTSHAFHIRGTFPRSYSAPYFPTDSRDSSDPPPPSFILPHHPPPHPPNLSVAHLIGDKTPRPRKKNLA